MALDTFPLGNTKLAKLLKLGGKCTALNLVNHILQGIKLLLDSPIDQKSFLKLFVILEFGAQLAHNNRHSKVDEVLLTELFQLVPYLLSVLAGGIDLVAFLATAVHDKHVLVALEDAPLEVVG